MSKVHTKTIKSSILPQNPTLLWVFFRKLETGEHQYFYAHEINTVFEKSYLLCNKADLITIQGKVEKFDIVENVKTQSGDSS